MPAEFRILQSDDGEDAPDGGSARPGYSATLRGSAQHGGLTRPYSQPQLSFPQENKQNCLDKKCQENVVWFHQTFENVKWKIFYF